MTSEIWTMLHQITAKASLFTGAQASKKLKKLFFRKLVDIFESSVPNISISQNWKMLTDVYKKGLAQFLLA